MHQSVYDFVTRVLGREEVEGKRVLEVGALDVNGSVRPYVTSLKPAEYIGTDKRKGKRVDRVVAVEKLIDVFGCDAFDVVLCLETLEHIISWRVALWTMFSVLDRGGLFVLTTRGNGFPRHDHPADHWRFHVNGWDPLRGDFHFRSLTIDPEAPGVFLCLEKINTPLFITLDRIHATAAPRWAG